MSLPVHRLALSTTTSAVWLAHIVQHVMVHLVTADRRAGADTQAHSKRPAPRANERKQPQQGEEGKNRPPSGAAYRDRYFRAVPPFWYRGHQLRIAALSKTPMREAERRIRQRRHQQAIILLYSFHGAGVTSISRIASRYSSLSCSISSSQSQRSHTNSSP